jgi:hypothetical protein
MAANHGVLGNLGVNEGPKKQLSKLTYLLRLFLSSKNFYKFFYVW